LPIAVFTIFIRSCFRVAELSGGFHGKLANQEVTFMILEGTMIIIAVLALTFVHPLFAFSGAWSNAGWSLRGRPQKGEDSEKDDHVADSNQFELEGQD
jgi:hypothetical protein